MDGTESEVDYKVKEDAIKRNAPVILAMLGTCCIVVKSPRLISIMHMVVVFFNLIFCGNLAVTKGLQNVRSIPVFEAHGGIWSVDMIDAALQAYFSRKEEGEEDPPPVPLFYFIQHF